MNIIYANHMPLAKWVRTMPDDMLIEHYERKVRIRDAHARPGGHASSHTAAVNELSLYEPELERRTAPITNQERWAHLDGID